MTEKRQYPRIGVTGSRRGWTPAQRSTLARYLRLWQDDHGAIELHHGDCFGVDAQAAALATALDYRIVCHPPQNERVRAFVPAHETRDALPYLERDHAIVDTANLLLALPAEDREVLRSGTWATIRYARRTGRPLVVVGPAGNVLEHSGFTERNTA